MDLHTDYMPSNPGTDYPTKDAALLRLLGDTLEQAMAFAWNRLDTAGLNLAYFGGTVWSGGVPTKIADGTIALTNNTTNYIERAPAGAISANTTGFTIGKTPLMTAVTLSGAITTVTDKREVPIPATERRNVRNVLINGNGMVNQRGAGSGVADDTYDADRWYTLTQTGTIAYSQLTDVADGTPFMMRMTQSQASAQRMGRAQIIESKDCKHLRGKTVTLSVLARISASQAIRYAILEWTGTADSVTSDVVNDWTSGTYTAGNFFLGSNLTISGVGAKTPGAATLTRLDKLTVTLGSAFNNLIVIAWTEGTAAQNVTLDLAIQLEEGSVATDYERIRYQDELWRCLRYFQFFGGAGAAENPGGSGCTYSGSQAAIALPLQAPMRAVPSLSVSAAGDWSFTTGSVGVVCSAINLNAAQSGNKSVDLDVSAASSPFATNAPVIMRAASTSAARLNFSAEL